MADIHHPSPKGSPSKIDLVLLLMLAILGALALYDFSAVGPTVQKALGSLSHTAIYVVFAVLAIAYLKATDADRIVAEAFKGAEGRMIVLAALIGSFAPFCSCEIIPLIAGMLAVGAPLSAVMALWLASPLMDLSVFAITAAALGWDFAVAKAIAAVVIGLSGGFIVKGLTSAGFFQNVLRGDAAPAGCCSCRKKSEKPVWRFWTDPERAAEFRSEVIANGAFLLKWLAFAYLIEALMIRYVPAEAVGAVVGGNGIVPVTMAAFLGAPLYLNGYAAPALVAGMVEQGMGMGPAMAFVLAGGVTCIPAMAAVWPLVRPQVFAAYLALGFAGAIGAGLLFAAV